METTVTIHIDKIEILVSKNDVITKPEELEALVTQKLTEVLVNSIKDANVSS